MSNFKKIDLGIISGLDAAPASSPLQKEKIFLRDKLGLTSCEISVNRAPKGAKAPFRHKHEQNEEIYIFLKGRGMMSVDGEEFPVQEGTCVKVEPGRCRYLENTGDGDLDYICIQAKRNSLEQALFDDGEKC